MALESRFQAQPMTAPAPAPASVRVRFGRASLVLASSLLLTLVAAKLSERYVTGRFDAALEAAADQEVGRVESRLSAYIALLRATRAFVEANGPALDRERFATFVDGLRIGSDYPGIQGIGWSPRIGTQGWKFEIL